MGARLVTTARDAACTALTHSKHARARLGCICPPSEAHRAYGRERSRRRRSGPARIRVYRGEEVDDIAVERLLCGESPRWVTTAERLTAVTILTGRGLSAARIAEVLVCSSATVHRYRTLARAAAVT